MHLFISNLALLITSGTLLVSGVGHARSLRDFKRSISGQGVWPKWFESVLAGSIPVIEIAIGLLGASLAFFGRRGEILAGVSVASGTLFLSYAAYSLYLLRRRPGAPCGCSSADRGVSEWVVARAAVLAGLAFVLLAGSLQQVGLGLLSPFHATIVITAALATGVIIWNLPSAMSDPWKEPARVIEAEGGSTDEL